MPSSSFPANMKGTLCIWAAHRSPSQGHVSHLRVTDTLPSTTLLCPTCHFLYDLTVTSWNWSRMAEPDGWGRLVTSSIVLSKMSSRLATITSISSNTDFSLGEKKKVFRKPCLQRHINLSVTENTHFQIEDQRVREFESFDRPGRHLGHPSKWPTDNKGMRREQLTQEYPT